MLTRRVIPCLDVDSGRVVKGVQFAGLRDAGDPAERAARYADEGADEVVMLDVSATRERRAAATETVRRIRRVLAIPLTVGGGIAGEDDAAALLDAGADRVSLNTAAVERPELVSTIARRFGTQCAVVAIDAVRGTTGDAWRVVTRSGTVCTGLDVVAWAARCEELGSGEILLTSLDRDGTRDGYDLDLTRAVAGAVGIPVIASGGAAEPGHLLAALEAGADAVLAASIFHDADYTVRAIKEYLASRGVEVRR